MGVWKRDPAIIELIRYFDEPKRRNRPELISDKEFRVIMGEVDLCRKDFSYAARNYFWIVNKEGEDIPFNLWESQELILDKWKWLKEKYPTRAQKLMILKARQLGASTVIEGLIAWSTIFFSNRNALVVSHNDAHAAYLYSIMLHIYDRLPWWMRPMCASRKQETGLLLANPNLDARSENPGNNSLISVQSASQLSGVGQGMKLNAVHACFSPETIVRLSNGTCKSIVDVSPGDLVVTGKGRSMPVKGVYLSTRSHENTAKVVLWGLARQPLETTLDHKILTPSGYRAAGELKRGEYVTVPARPITDSVAEISVIRHATGGSPLTRERFQLVSRMSCNYDLGWLCGLYLAEGTIQLNKKLREEFQPSALYLSIDRDEEGDCLEAIERVLPGKHVRVYRHKDSRTSVLTVSDSSLSRWMYREFGAGEGKTIPDWVWSAGYRFCDGIISGYIYGDGHVHKVENKITASSTRAAIVFQLRDLVVSRGFGWSSIGFREAGKYYGRNCKEAWVWTASGETSRKMRQYFNWPEINRKKHNTKDHWEWDGRGGVSVEVASVSSGFCHDFYDLEVEAEEHNFCTIQCCVSNSEFADWDFTKFKDIIDGDMVHAIADNPYSFAFLESTGKGAGSPSEEMWTAQNELIEQGEEAEWTPLFLPWFFETTRVMAPEGGWSPQQPEVDMQEKISRDWVRCTNLECNRYSESVLRRVSCVGGECPECHKGVLDPVILSMEQLRFMQNRRANAEKKGPDSVKRLLQELASTATEAFQLSGIQVFPPSAQQFVNTCINKNPRIWGNIDRNGKLHYPKFPSSENYKHARRCACEDCTVDHRYDMEHPLQIWELPEPDAKYCIGADVAEGLSGKADFSVAFVNKYYENGRGPDEQVAMWRSNTVDPIAFAAVLNGLGRLYNTALIAVEVNKYDMCDMALRMHHMYPNPFIWKHYDSKNPMSTKLGWVTNQRTKSMLWQTAVNWLKGRMWIIRSDIFANEMKRFQKDDYDDTSASAERNFHDDVIIAGMIALFCGHDMDHGEGDNYIPAQSFSSLVKAADWTNSCDRCHKSWSTEEYPARKCHFCRSMLISSHRNSVEGQRASFDISEMGKTREEIQEENGENIRTDFDPPEDSFATI